jgi:hypothetical protein
MEMREISVVIPVLDKEFSDDKEISELFTYVFEKSALYGDMHPPMKLKMEYDTGGNKIFTFTLSLRADDGQVEKRKRELEMLIDGYNIAERDYIRFKKFGNIESGAIIRKGLRQ